MFTFSYSIVVIGPFQVVSVILAPSKSNLCAFLVAVSSLRGTMAPSGLLLRSATGGDTIDPFPIAQASIRVDKFERF